MKKFILSVLVCLIVSACGQKGPLIVDYSASEQAQAVDGDVNQETNETQGRLNRQLEGQPIIIYR